MNKLKIKELLKRVNDLGKPQTVKIDNWENGIYKPIFMPIEEAKQQAVEEMNQRL